MGITLMQRCRRSRHFFFFFNDTATTEIYTLSLHDALPISRYVIAASGGEQDYEKQHLPSPRLPRNRDVPCQTHINCRATATAFSAARRTLSATNHSQAASGRFRSGVIAPTAIPPCPALPTLVGGSKSPPRTSNASIESELSSASISG